MSRPRPRARLGAGLALLVCVGAGCNRAPQPREAEPLRREASHSVPFVLELYGPASPSGDTLMLTAKLRGSGAVLPVDLEVVTPRGIALSEGAAQERVRLSAEQPLLERRYTLMLSQPLGEPVRVRARLADNPAVGAFAERTYPPAAETSPASTSASAPTAGRFVAGVPIGQPIDAVRQD